MSVIPLICQVNLVLFVLIQGNLLLALSVGGTRIFQPRRHSSICHSATNYTVDDPITQYIGNGTSSTPEDYLDTNKPENNGNGTSSTPEDCLDANIVDRTHALGSETGSNEPKNIGNGTFHSREDTLNAYMVDGSLAVGTGASCNIGGLFPTKMDRNSPTPFIPKVYAEGSVTDNMSTNSDDKVTSETCLESKVTIVDADSSSECNGTLNGTASSKSASKMSLLGHVPHGSQVVNHLLKEYGDDGIREFCQRWRQVFVDAIKPRFLPAGWDVTHSGRRDFGDFSVYNSAKKGSAPVTFHYEV